MVKKEVWQEEHKKISSVRSFISFYDDDSQQKNQSVIIIKRGDFGVEFKYDLNEKHSTIIPWTRILKVKIKESEDIEDGNKDE